MSSPERQQEAAVLLTEISELSNRLDFSIIRPEILVSDGGGRVDNATDHQF